MKHRVKVKFASENDEERWGESRAQPWLTYVPGFAYEAATVYDVVARSPGDAVECVERHLVALGVEADVEPVRPTRDLDEERAAADDYRYDRERDERAS